MCLEVSRIFSIWLKLNLTQKFVFFDLIMALNILMNLWGFFLKEKGILYQCTCRETPWQNGIAKRKNKHLLEVARAIMFSMNVPKYLWCDAILTASYLINRMPTRVLQFQTPLHSLKQLFPLCRIYSELPLSFWIHLLRLCSSNVLFQTGSHGLKMCLSGLCTK